MESTLTGNIGPAGQRRRRRAGVLFVALALVLLAGLMFSGASRWWRLGAFPLLWVGALGFTQAQARTCVAFAARGACELDDGTSSPLDAATAARMKVQARAVMTRSTLLAAAVTALALLIV